MTNDIYLFPTQANPNDIGLRNGVSGGTTYNETVGESIAAADGQTVTVLFVTALGESGVASDGQTVTVLFSTTLGESGTASDGQTATAVFGATLGESGSVVDVSAGTAVFTTQTAELAAVADALAAQTDFSDTIAELAAIADALDATVVAAAGGHFAPRFRIPSGYYGQPRWIAPVTKPKTVRRPKVEVVPQETVETPVVAPVVAPTAFDGFSNTQITTPLPKTTLSRPQAVQRFDFLDDVDGLLAMLQDAANQRAAELAARQAQDDANALWNLWLAQAEAMAEQEEMEMLLFLVHTLVD